MNINLKTLTTLLLGSMFLANITNATGVVEIPNNPTDEEIIEAKNLLKIPTLSTLGGSYPSSAFILEETDKDEYFTINKFLINSNGIYDSISYKVNFDKTFGGNVVYEIQEMYFSWDVSNIGVVFLTESDSSDYDLSIKVNSLLNQRKVTFSLSENEDISNSFAGLYGSTGAAIYNNGYEVGNITGDFIGNYGLIGCRGAAIYNATSSSIESISSNFIGNYGGTYWSGISSLSMGGAIYNLGEIGNMVGDFIGNSSMMGGAIYNTGELSNITGDFIGNSSFIISDYVLNYAQGGAICNIRGTIGDIVGDFISNYAQSENNSYSASGGAIYCSLGTIGNITGDFIDNYTHNSSSGASGGAIALSVSNVGNITGNFVNNRAYNAGGAVYIVSSTVGDIVGNFIGNSVTSTSTYYIGYGGAIYNAGNINSITGDFIDNSSRFGAAIYNYSSGYIGDIIGNFISNEAWYDSCGIIYNSGGTIGNITGDFIDNYGCGIVLNGGSIGNVSGDFIANAGGAILIREGSIGDITGDFIGNESEYGGAIYLDENVVSVLALDRSVLFSGNTLNDEYIAFYAIGSMSENSIINLNAFDSNKIVVNDSIVGSDSVFWQILNINNGETSTTNTGNYSTVEINNIIRNHTINVHNGTLELGEFAGDTYDLSKYGIDNTLTVSSSSAFLNDCIVNISSDAILVSKGDYLGDGSNIITNEGILELNGGTLNNIIVGNGLIRISSSTEINAIIQSTSFEVFISSIDDKPSLIIGENVSLADNSTFDIYLYNDFFANVGDIFTLVESAVDIDNVSSYVVETIYLSNGAILDSSCYSYYSSDGRSVSLVFDTSIVNGVAVPEPSTYALIFGALSLGFVYYRKRK